MQKPNQGIKAKKCVVFFDFDNTITPCDVFDDMLLRFSKDERWAGLEKKWKDGKIGSYECLNGQIKGIRITKKPLDKYLAGIRLDGYFKRLVKFLDTQKIKTIVLSDNFDYILKGILKHNAFKKLKVYSNKLRLAKDRFIPSFPFRDKSCRVCAHCKTKNLLANTDKGSITIYIGDGRSDICPSKYADIIFAKEDLLKHYKNGEINCIPYKSLKDVYNYFKRRLI